jgi:hypothetical protein
LQLHAGSVQICFSSVFIVTPFVLDEFPVAAGDSAAPEHNDTPPEPEIQAVPPGIFPQNKLENIRIRHLSAAYFIHVFSLSDPVFRKKTEKYPIKCFSRLESPPFPGYITVCSGGMLSRRPRNRHITPH